VTDGAGIQERIIEQKTRGGIQDSGVRSQESGVRALRAKRDAYADVPDARLTARPAFTSVMAA
jgi:hypothetical protein